MSTELIAGLAMVVLMMGTILTKYVSTVLLARLRRRQMEAESQLREVRARLKVIQNEQAVAEQNEKSLNGKKGRLEKRLPSLKKELESLSK